MAYKLHYSDYPGTDTGPPDPERWVGPQGPPGPQGIPGPIADGGPFLPLSGGTVSGPLYTTATGGTVARSEQARAADVANVLDYGADPTGIADSSVAINAAAAKIAPNGRNKAVYLPAGWYRVDHQITLTAGQCLFGDSRGSSIITVAQTFDPAASSVILLTPGSLDPGPVVRDLGITFVQPPGLPSRAGMLTLAGGGTSGVGGTGVRYPWAIAAGGPSFRSKIERVRIGGAWDGITSNGFNAVFWLDDVEVGALDCGVSLGEGASGIQDFCHIDNFHFWNFDFTTAQQQAVFSDGQTIALRFGNVNGLNASGINCLIGRVVFTAAAAAGWFYITNLALDYWQSTLTVNAANWLQITNLYSTSQVGATAPDITIAGGRVLITNAFLGGAGAQLQISVTGGDVSMVEAYLQHDDLATGAVSVLGGTLRLNTVKVQATGTHTAPLITQGGTGILQATNLDLIGAGGSSGTGVQINVDAAGNLLDKVALGPNWHNVIAFGSNGNYGAVFVAPLDGSSMQTGSNSFMRFAATAHNCTAYGYNTLLNHADAGNGNSAFGAFAGLGVTTSTSSTLIGYQAGQSGPMSGAANTCLGAVTGYSLTSGASNTIVGVYADAGIITTGSNNILISAGGALNNITASMANTINIGNIFNASGINTPATSVSMIPGLVRLPALQAASSYATDAAAAAGGVAVGQLYRNGSVVQVRVA